MEYLVGYFVQQNKGATERRKSRTLCLMDATGSMSHLLQNAKNTVSIMFERAAAVLKEAKLPDDAFSLKFAVYRNYNTEKILEFSPWETKPANLRKFMEKIGVSGGIAEEAVEIGLWHVNQELNDNEEGVSQVLLIGDAPAQTKKQAVDRRQSSRYDWENSIYKGVNDYQKELVNIIDHDVPVHTFFVDRWAETNFRAIATETGGSAQFLDVNDPVSGSDRLTDMVTEQILKGVAGGDNNQAQALLSVYRSKFPKTYSA